MTDRVNDDMERANERLFNPHVPSSDDEDRGKDMPPVELDDDPLVTRPWAPQFEEGADVDPAGRPVKSTQ